MITTIPKHNLDLSEASLQRLVLGWLHKQRPRAFFYRTNTGAASTIDAHGNVDGFMRFGVPGQADVTGVAAGRFVAIELKRRTGRKRKEQEQYGADVRAAGGVHYFARSLDQALVPVYELLGVAFEVER